jgi:hypothetical protein
MRYPSAIFFGLYGSDEDVGVLITGAFDRPPVHQVLVGTSILGLSNICRHGQHELSSCRVTLWVSWGSTASLKHV